MFAPAGMMSTSWRDDHARVTPGRADAYTPDQAGALRLDMPFENVVGPGGLLTTVGDLQRWNLFLERPPQAAREWTRLVRETRGALADGTVLAYGMGLEYAQSEGSALVSHAGATAGYRAYLAKAPEHRLSAALLCNAGVLNTEELGPKLVSLFLPKGTPGASGGEAPSAQAAVDADLPGRYRNLRTGALVTLTRDEAGLRFNGGAPFTQAGADVLANADRSRRARVRRAPSGAITGISLTRMGNSAVELGPVSLWSPDQASLAEFEGRFDSDDAEAGWTVRLEDGVLRARGPTKQTFLLDPIYRDNFAGRDAYWTFAFRRGPSGRVTGLTMSRTRTRGVAFKVRATDARTGEPVTP